MTALFNNQRCSDEILCLVNDRALQFGDGFFETIRVRNDQPCLLDYHLSRLSEGAEASGFLLPSYLTKEKFSADIRSLMKENKLAGEATAKLIAWRSNGDQKAYLSKAKESNLLLLVKPPSPLPGEKKTAGFSDDVFLHYWKLSRFKTISALPYVTAARERDDKGLDELIILSTEGYVSECVSSNIFWMLKEKIYTPSLKTGCVAGVMRRFIMEQFEKQNVPVEEVEATTDELLKAEAVFTSNSQGIQSIRSINHTNFSNPLERLAQYGLPVA